MVNKEFTAQFFKAEKRDGSGTGEKLRENQVLQSLLLEDGAALLQGLQGPRESSLRPGNAKRLSEKSRSSSLSALLERRQNGSVCRGGNPGLQSRRY